MIQKMRISARVTVTVKKAPSTHKELLKACRIIIDDYSGYERNESLIYTIYVLSLLKANSRYLSNGSIEYSGSLNGCFGVTHEGDGPILPIYHSYHKADHPDNTTLSVTFEADIKEGRSPQESILDNVQESVSPKLRESKLWTHALRTIYNITASFTDGIIYIGPRPTGVEDISDVSPNKNILAKIFGAGISK